MWKEIFADDKNLEYYANLRNIYDCTQSYNVDNMKHAIKHGRKFYVYEDETYTIVIGFKFNKGHQKSQYVCFVIKGFGDDAYYHEAFKIIGQKTREYLIETETDLVLLWKGIEIANPMAIRTGSATSFFDKIKLAWDEVGIKGERDYEKHLTVVKVIDGSKRSFKT